MDIDLCGPSVPHLLNVENSDVHQCPEGWVPVYTDATQTLAVMSIGECFAFLYVLSSFKKKKKKSVETTMKTAVFEQAD